MSEEGERLGMNIKIVESGGISLKSQLVRPDLTGCLFPDCYICMSETRGGSHTRRGAVYELQCVACEDQGIVTTYTGETGHNAYHRGSEHISDVRRNETSNAMAKHLNLYHPEKISDPSVFRMKVHKNFARSLDRQVFEGVLIHNSEADITMNSKAEFMQPSVTRVTTTREVNIRRDRGR